jgi:hypothetical protein
MGKMIAIDPKQVKAGDMIWFYDPEVMSNGGFFPVSAVKRGGKLVVDVGSDKFTFTPHAKALVRQLLGVEEAKE